MAAKIIAVDIEETTIRLLQVRKNRIERWASAAVDAGPTSDGVTPDPARLGSQVRQLMRASGINSGQVVLSLSGLYSVSRVLTLPLPSQTETEGVLLGLVQEALPAGGLTLRYRVISANEAGRRVLALGVPSDIVQGQTTVMQAAGLRVYAMEPRTLALTTAVNQEWAVIINVEPSSLDLVVVATGIPSIMRTVPLPTGLDAEERAGQVALALEKTVAFYHEQNPLLQLPSDTPLFLVGSLAEDPVLRKSVTDAVPYPLATFEPSLEFPSYLPCSQHAVTIGLALSQLSRRGRARRGARPLFIDFLRDGRTRERAPPSRAAGDAAAN
ncbi:MAG: hypothetical protein HYU30_09365 [Chloroflexi bacterium]|nr:hypothetical protein [Chloroflexota bacterium]